MTEAARTLASEEGIVTTYNRYGDELIAWMVTNKRLSREQAEASLASIPGPVLEALQAVGYWPAAEWFALTPANTGGSGDGPG